MKLSKTSEYAIRVLVFLAGNPGKRYSVNRLHLELNLPYKYLGRLMSNLAEAEIVVDKIHRQYPHLEVEPVYGGQPHYHYIVSIE